MRCKPLWVYSPVWAVSHIGAELIEADSTSRFICHLVSTISSALLVLIFLVPPKYHTFYISYWRVCFVITCQPKIFYVEKDGKIRKFLELPKWVKLSQKQNYQPSQDSDIQIPRHHASPLKLINYSTWTIATEKSVCSRGRVLCSRTPCEIKKTTDLIHCRVLYFEFSRESPWLENSSPKGLAHTAVQKVGTA